MTNPIDIVKQIQEALEMIRTAGLATVDVVLAEKALALIPDLQAHLEQTNMADASTREDEVQGLSKLVPANASSVAKLIAEIEELKEKVYFVDGVPQYHPYGGKLNEIVDKAIELIRNHYARADVKPKPKEECERICELHIRLNEDGSYSYSHSGLLPMDKVIEAIIQQNPDAMPSRPDVNQELVEVLKEAYNGILGITTAIRVDDNKEDLLLRCEAENRDIKQALAKHKAGESAGFTEDELIKLCTSSFVDGFDTKPDLEVAISSIIHTLKEAGVLRVKGE